MASIHDFSAALSKIDEIAGTSTGTLKHDLERIANIGKDIGAELVAGVITPAKAASNFEALTLATRTRLATEARTVATAASGLDWLDTALRVLRVIVL